MREILADVETWMNAGKKVALATVVKVYGSAPRGLGSKMAVNEAGQMVGSVSGGCVEGAVVSEALKIIRSGQSRLITYGVTQEQAVSVGLACGGTIEVFVEVLSSDYFKKIAQDLKSDRLAVTVKVLNGPLTGEQIYAYPEDEVLGSFSSAEIQKAVEGDLSTIFKRQQPDRRTYLIENKPVEVFFDTHNPSPKLVIVGAVHIAIPLVEFGRLLGFHTIVVDPRKAFATHERFPNVDELVLAWPEDYLPGLGLDEGSYLVVVSHDDKLDVPALVVGCKSKARYIGALGSKKTFAQHVADLKEMGIADEAIERIHSPIGMDINARGPQEIALAIIAQVTAVRNGLDA